MATMTMTMTLAAAESQPLIPSAAPAGAVAAAPAPEDPDPHRSSAAVAMDEGDDDYEDTGDEDETEQKKANYKALTDLKEAIVAASNESHEALEEAFESKNTELKVDYEPTPNAEEIPAQHRAIYKPIIDKILGALHKQVSLMLRDGHDDDADGGILAWPVDAEGDIFGEAMLRAMRYKDADPWEASAHPYFIIDLLKTFSQREDWPMQVPTDVVLFALVRLLLPTSQGGERYKPRTSPDIVQQPDPIKEGKMSGSFVYKPPNESFLYIILKNLMDALASLPPAKELLQNKHLSALVSCTLQDIQNRKGLHTLGQYFFMTAVRIMCSRDADLLRGLIAADKAFLPLLTAVSQCTLRCSIVIMPDMPLFMDGQWRLCFRDSRPVGNDYDGKHFFILRPQPDDPKQAVAWPKSKNNLQLENMQELLAKLLESAESISNGSGSGSAPKPKSKPKPKKKKADEDEEEASKPKKPKKNKRSSGKEEKKEKAPSPKPKPAAPKIIPASLPVSLMPFPSLPLVPPPSLAASAPDLLHSNCMPLETHRSLMQQATQANASKEAEIKRLTKAVADRDVLLATKEQVIEKSEQLRADFEEAKDSAIAALQEETKAHTVTTGKLDSTKASFEQEVQEHKATKEKLQAAEHKITELQDSHMSDAQSRNAQEAKITMLTEENASLRQQLENRKRKQPDSAVEASSSKRGEGEDGKKKASSKGKGKGKDKPASLAGPDGTTRSGRKSKPVDHFVSY